MKSVWLLAPHGQARSVLDNLAEMGLCHVADCATKNGSELEKLGIERVFPEITDIERRVQLLRETFDTLSVYHKSAREFLQNFITTPVEVTKADVERALKEVEIDEAKATAERMLSQTKISDLAQTLNLNRIKD